MLWRPAEELYEIIPPDHKQPYNARHLLECILDDGHLDEFQADYAKEMVTGHARIRGIQVGIIANNRGMIRSPAGGPPRFGGIIYTEMPRKSPTSSRRVTGGKRRCLHPGCFGIHDRVGAEHSGIIRAGARFVEAMATALVPKIVLTINHASGAGYYAMAGQGFDPDFIFSWPTGRTRTAAARTATSWSRWSPWSCRRRGRRTARPCSAATARCPPRRPR